VNLKRKTNIRKLALEAAAAPHQVVVQAVVAQVAAHLVVHHPSLKLHMKDLQLQTIMRRLLINQILHHLS
jgi:hypothetical protein